MSRRRGHGEGSISKRDDGRWEARVDLGWRDGKRRRKTLLRPDPQGGDRTSWRRRSEACWKEAPSALRA
jgi:hypothetical protein